MREINGVFEAKHEVLYSLQSGTTTLLPPPTTPDWPFVRCDERLQSVRIVRGTSFFRFKAEKDGISLLSTASMMPRLALNSKTRNARFSHEGFHSMQRGKSWSSAGARPS